MTEPTQALTTQPLLTVTEYCVLNKHSERHFYNDLAKGKGPKTLKIGRRRYIRPEDREAYLATLAE